MGYGIAAPNKSVYQNWAANNGDDFPGHFYIRGMVDVVDISTQSHSILFLVFWESNPDYANILPDLQRLKGSIDQIRAASREWQARQDKKPKPKWQPPVRVVENSEKYRNRMEWDDSSNFDTLRNDTASPAKEPEKKPEIEIQARRTRKIRVR